MPRTSKPKVRCPGCGSTQLRSVRLPYEKRSAAGDLGCRVCGRTYPIEDEAILDQLMAVTEWEKKYSKAGWAVRARTRTRKTARKKSRARSAAR